MAHDPALLLDLERKALEIRKWVVKMVHEAGSGHPGGSLSITDIVTALYFRVMRHDPANPSWPDRDRFVLSKGHSCVSLYAALAMCGYFPMDDLMTLRKTGSHLQGHPALGKTPGVEWTGGSEAQGISGAVGMALGARLDERPTRVFCIIGDGECQEGQVWEAAMAAGHHKLDNLTVVLDRNGLQTDGHTEEIMGIEPIKDKWLAFRWHVMEIDGHDFGSILTALDEAGRVKGKPTMIIAKTLKGKGVSYMEGTLSFHGKAPSDEELEKALTELDQAEKRLGQKAKATGVPA